MSEIQENRPNEPLSVKDKDAKTHAFIAYGLMILGLFIGISWIIGAIWAMVKKSDAEGTIFEDHYSNIIKTFWWGIIFSIIGFVTSFFFIGYFILMLVWFWSIYKVVKGLARTSSNKSYK